MKKWIALLLSLTILCLCGCGNHQTEQEQTDPPVVQTEPPVIQTEDTVTEPDQTDAPAMEYVGLSLWVVSDSIWADQEAIANLLQTFNSYYPNIILEIQHKSPDELSGNKPDIVLADAEQIAQWNTQVGMEDLSDIWAAGLYDDVYEVARTYCAGEIGYHTVPLCLIPYCMAVNTAVFESAEAMELLNTVNHTWNTTSFLKAVQQVYDNGVDTVGAIYCKEQQEDMLTRLFVSNLYDGEFLDKKTGTYNVSGDNMGKAMSALARQEGIAFDAALDAENAREQFLRGETAFVLNWNASLQVQHMANDDILFMHYPSADSRPETRTQVIGFGVFDNGDPVKVAASRTFVTYMCGNDAAVRATENIPARASLRDVYKGTGLEQVMNELNKLTDYLTGKEPSGELWESARREWIELLQNMDTAGENWEEVLEKSQSDLNRLFPELFPPETETTAPSEP